MVACKREEIVGVCLKMMTGSSEASSRCGPQPKSPARPGSSAYTPLFVILLLTLLAENLSMSAMALAMLLVWVPMGGT